jgi:hypothetical protein
MTGAERIALLSRIEMIRRASDRRTWIAAFLFVAVLALGAWSYWSALPPRPQDDRLFGYAYIVAALVALHLGIARDRRFRFDAFLAANFVSPLEIYLSKLGAMLACTASATIGAFTVALAASAGDLQYAAWYSLLFAFVTLLFLPMIVLAEAVLDIEYPVAIVALLFMAVVSIVGRTGDAKRVLRIMGLTLSRYDYTGLALLGVRVAAAGLLVALLYPLFKWRVSGKSAD